METKAQLFDIKIFTAILILLGIGIAFMYGASAPLADKLFSDRSYFFNRQLIYGIMSVIILVVVSRINPNVFFKLANILLIITVISLVLVLIPGIGSERKGGRRWINLGFFHFQPSELAKITLLIFLSKHLALHEEEIPKKLNKLIFPGFFAVLLIFTLVLLEKDFSSSILILVVALNLIFIAGVQLKYFAYLAITGIPVIYFIITSYEHMKLRLNIYLMKFFLPNYIPHQEKQAMKAINEAGFFGNGLGIGSFHSKIPESHTDFYFASIIADIGLLGGIFVILVFCYVFIRNFMLVKNTNDKRFVFLIYGVTLLFVWQTLLNLGSVLGLLPIAGLPLPFLSYGGNSLFISSFGMGLILGISRFRSS